MPRHTVAALLLLSLSLTAPQAAAQMPVAHSPNGRFTLCAWGMTNIDLGAYFVYHPGDGEKHACPNGMALNDTRLGCTAAFDSVWKAKIEICYADKKVSFKDITLERLFAGGRHTIKAGNFLLPFGQKRLGPHCRFIEFATPDVAMSPNRKMGAAYYYAGRRANAMCGLFSEDDADDFQLTNRGLSVTAHVSCRVVDREGAILQLSATPRWIHPRKATTLMGKSEETFATRLPLGRVSVAAFNVAQVDLYALAIVRRFYFEAHYMLTHGVRSADRLRRQLQEERPDATFPLRANHSTQGAWAQLSWAFLRPTQTYNRSWGAAFNPGPKTLELAARWSYTALGDQPLAPNRETGVTLGLNYYPNRWLAAKLNVTYTHAGAGGDVSDQDMAAVAGRLIFML